MYLAPNKYWMTELSSFYLISSSYLWDTVFTYIIYLLLSSATTKFAEVSTYAGPSITIFNGAVSFTSTKSLVSVVLSSFACVLYEKKIQLKISYLLIDSCPLKYLEIHIMIFLIVSDDLFFKK